MCFMIILISTGCKKEKNQDADLLNIRWILKSIQNTATNVSIDFPADASKNISIVFTDSLKTVLFNGLCNNGSGIYSYSPEKGEIRIENLKTTLIGCTYVSWETYTVQNLIDASRYNINGNLLGIYSKGDYNLFFQKE